MSTTLSYWTERGINTNAFFFSEKNTSKTIQNIQIVKNFYGHRNSSVWIIFLFFMCSFFLLNYSGDSGLEIGYSDKICHHDDVRRTKPHTPNRGRLIFILVLVFDLELMSNFFLAQKKRFLTNCLLFRMISRDSQV